jgi:hypothetical protein
MRLFTLLVQAADTANRAADQALDKFDKGEITREELSAVIDAGKVAHQAVDAYIADHPYTDADFVE